MDHAENRNLWLKTAYLVQRVPGGALLFAVIGLVLLGYFGWYYYGADHLDHALYALRLENLKVTPQPACIKSNVAEDVYKNGRLDRISLLDPRANAAIAQAFETHNWVKSVSRVTKAAGGEVVVDLVYRRPAAMVYYQKQNSDLDPADVVKGFFPIDDAGTVLPTQDFTSDDVWNYFMIIAENARPAGDVGMPYGDVRITEALSLCALLEPHRELNSLQEIWVRHDNLANGSSPWAMSILTRDKTREIAWGHAPNVQASGELHANEKLSRMLSWLKEFQPGSSVDQRKLDVRFASPTVPAAHTGRRSY